MLLEALLALVTLAPRADGGLVALRARVAGWEVPTVRVERSPPVLPYFSATARTVSNWREEAGAALMPTSLALVVQYAASEPAFVARCVRLNNYWCIKQARWSGELGGDGEGHTAFAGAADGADAAAQLLRRYYREYGRRTALAIVRRWAPAECGLVRPGPVAARRPAAPKVSTALAPRGIGGTLRARYLAQHARGGAPRRVAAARTGARALRVQPWSALARLSGHPRRSGRTAAPLPPLRPAPDIATGIGAPAAPEPKPQVVRRSVGDPLAPIPPAVRRTSAVRSAAAEPAALLAPDRLVAESAALPSLVAGLPAGSLLDLRVPPPLCSGDEARIRNYAGRIAASVGLKPDDDLRLFEADGAPSARLMPVMLAMSSVELGSLRATPELVSAAIARLTGSSAMAATSAGLTGTRPAP